MQSTRLSISRLIAIILLCFVIFTVKVEGQPLPCGSNPKMTSFCNEACIICDINGFKGRHNSNVPGSLPKGFCTTTVHNAQWIGFIAGSQNLTIALTVSNCTRKDGLEMTVYESRDCQIFKQVFNCDGEVLPGTTQEFKNIEPLIIGQYYFLTMDGNGGDNCDWLLEVKEGTTLVSPLVNSGQIIGPNVACPQTPIPFEVERPIGATEFFWDINGISQNLNADSVALTFPSDGLYTVCVQSANVCNQAPKNCRQIEIRSIPQITRNDTICTGECLTLNGDDYCASGKYEIHYQLANGCDSTVFLNLEVLDISTQNAMVYICNDDALIIGGKKYDQTGKYEIHLPSFFHCDSIINLDLTSIECDIEGSAQITNVQCFGKKDGSTVFTISQGTPPFTYKVRNFAGNVIAEGAGVLLDQPTPISGLGIGQYFIDVSDNFKNREIIILELNEPPPTTINLQKSDFNGYNVDCFGNNNGSINAIASGGTPPHEIAWPLLNKTGNKIDQLAAGDIKLQVTDRNGCILDSLISLNSPDSLDLQATYFASSCLNNTSGKIAIEKINGGIPPFQYSIDNKSYGMDSIFENLEIGLREVRVKDKNGCVKRLNDTIFPAQIPIISLVDFIDVDLGDEIILDATLNEISIHSIHWIPGNEFTCPSCLSSAFKPLKSGLRFIEVTSQDNCVRTDSLQVNVTRKVKVYAPNIINTNSISDGFSITTGNDVAQILEMNIYDRWGNVVYKANNGGPWDGKTAGKWNTQGIYIWKATVEMIDGDTLHIYGNFLLLLQN